MDTTIGIAWLVLLTVGMLINARLLLIGRRELIEHQHSMDRIMHKLEAVELKENILELKDLLNSSAIRRSTEVQRRANDLLTRLKADPLMHDRYWTEAQALENALK